MKGAFEAVKISEHTYWVGAIDWGLRNFHGYTTNRGSTYNAYLIEAEDYILIDTVKAPFYQEFISRISSVTDVRNIRYVISNHSEMDHSGSLPATLMAANPEKVFASEMGVKTLSKHFRLDREVNAVGDNETLEIGGVYLSFLETRMLHWPDSMMTYLVQDKLLFSQDGFGMHLASAERFADEITESILLEEGSKYFANILLPYAALVEKALDRVSSLGVPIDILAPDHGPIWRKDIGKILGLYAQWASQKPTPKAVIAYDTMWGSTKLMAEVIAEGIERGGCSVVVHPLSVSDRSEVMKDSLDAGALIVGTPTINNEMFPTVADFLTYAKGLRPKNKIGAAFGSYGWSGEGAKVASEILSGMKVELISEPIIANYVPDLRTIEKCRELGALVAERLKGVQ
ncbi:MAG: FprA family A-type flavoprotein [Actinomycetota bacterium]|nr:FprA family A-type flavoprotein [Actinomycetota bacterium]